MKNKCLILVILVVAAVAGVVLLLLPHGAQTEAALQADNPYAAIEQDYDEMQRKGQWQQIVECSRRQPPQSLACQKVALLALYRTGKADQLTLRECLSDSREVLTSPLASMMMSDVYIQIGVVSMAQRAAFESMVKEPDPTKCGRALRRLTECAIVTGQNDLALKYISQLEELSAHRDWAHAMRRIAKHPELITEQPVYESLKKAYEETADQFFM